MQALYNTTSDHPYNDVVQVGSKFVGVSVEL